MCNFLAIKEIILSIFIWERRIFCLSSGTTSLKFLSNLMRLLISNLWKQSYMRESNPTSCNIQPNLHKRKMLVHHENKSKFQKAEKGVGWRFGNFHIPKSMNHGNKGQLDVFRDFVYKYLWWKKSYPQLGKWFHIKRFLHHQLRIVLHGNDKKRSL